MTDKYRYIVEWSEEDECYISTCTELDYLTAFGESFEEALHEIRIAVEGAIELLKEDGLPIPEPIASKSFRGKILTRVSPDQHKKLYIGAKENDLSLNQYIVSLINKGMDSSDIENCIKSIEKTVLETREMIMEKSAIVDTSFYSKLQTFSQSQVGFNISGSSVQDAMSLDSIRDVQEEIDFEKLGIPCNYARNQTVNNK